MSRFFSPPPTDPNRNILLISVDTLRADHMSLYGYERETSPQIDAFFSRGTVYDRAYCTATFTPPSVMTILTGLLPQEHGVRRFAQLIEPDVETIADLLGKAGYQTAAVVSNGALIGEGCGLNERFETYDDYVDEKEPYRDHYERSAERTSDAVIRWLHEERDETRSHFLWVHYQDPHGPYMPPEPKVADFSHDSPVPIDLERASKYLWIPGVTDGLEYVDRYDEEIAYMDREIERLLDEYKRLELADSALIIFTADHGESLLERDFFFAHGMHVYEEVARVPLAIIGPGFHSARISNPVSLVDIAPTILEYAGVPIPEKLSGSALRRGPQSSFVFSESSGIYSNGQWRCAIDGDRKWVVRIGREGRTIDEEFYFDLRNDPEEKIKLDWPGKSEVPEELLKLCLSDPDPAGFPQDYIEGAETAGSQTAPGAKRNILEILKGLGYLK